MANATIGDRKHTKNGTTSKSFQHKKPKLVSQTKSAESSGPADTFKKQRKLTKKLRQIDALKARQQKGEELSTLQLTKIGLEASIRKQLKELSSS